MKIEHNHLRPLQPVLYVGRLMVKQLTWKGLSLSELFHFDKVCRTIGDDDILTYLTLNTANSESIFSCVVPVDGDNIIKGWYQYLNSEDETTVDALSRIEDKYRSTDIVKHLEKALSTNVSLSDDLSTGYELIHDEKTIFVVVDSSRCNLLNTTTVNSLQFQICREIVRTYCIYHDYTIVAQSPWFSAYMEKLNYK